MALEILNSLPHLTVNFCGLIFHLLLFNGFIRDPLKCLKNSKTYFVANLAAADLLVCLISSILPFILHFMPYRWYDLAQMLALNFAMCASFITILSISVDRYFMVAYPIRHRNFVTRKVISLWLVCIWVLSAVYPAKVQLAGKQDHDYLVANSSGLLITILIAILGGLTYSHLKKQSLNLRLQNCTSGENRAQEIRTSQELRFLNTIIIIASIVIVCLLPSAILHQVFTFRDISKDSGALGVKIIRHISNLLFYLNFAVNPIVYVLRLPNYRKTFLKLHWKRGNSR